MMKKNKEEQKKSLEKILYESIKQHNLSCLTLVLEKKSPLWRNYSKERPSPDLAHNLFTFSQHVRLSNSVLHLTSAEGKKRKKIFMEPSYIGLPIQDAGQTIGALCTFSEDSKEENLYKLKSIAKNIILYKSQKSTRKKTKYKKMKKTLAGLTHEINGPLAIARSLLELMLEEVMLPATINTELWQQRLRKALTAVDRVKKITGSFEKNPSQNKQEPVEMISLRSLVEEAAEFSAPRLKKANAEFHIQLPQEDILLEGNRIQISQVLVNLLNNAADAVAKEKIRRVEVEAKYNSNSICISIKDSGVGIPKEIETKLMRPFFTTKGPKEGTGLGLYLSRQMIENHSGALLLTEDQSLTCFTILLPLRQSTPASLKN